MSQGGSWGWTNPDVQSIEQPPSGPSRRQIGMVAVATLTIVVGLLAYTVLGSNNGGKGSALNPIAQAAERTASYPGERVAISGVITTPLLPQAIQMHGGGAFNGDTDKARLKLNINAAGAVPAIAMTEVVDGTDFYLSSPAFAGGLPEGKTWMKLDLSSLLDSDAAAAGQSDPREQLKLLEQVSDSFTRVGDESVRGHPTTHYSASISGAKQVESLRAAGDDDAADLLEKLQQETGTTSTPVEVWIDDRNLVRRFSMSLTLPAQEAGSVTMNMTMEFFDFGAKPQIVVPPESQVFDASDAIKDLPYLDS